MIFKKKIIGNRYLIKPDSKRYLNKWDLPTYKSPEILRLTATLRSRKGVIFFQCDLLTIRKIIHACAT